MKSIKNLVPTHNSQLAMKIDSLDIQLLHCGYDNNSIYKGHNAPIFCHSIVSIYEGSGYFVYQDKRFKIDEGDIILLPIGVPYATIPQDCSHFKLAYVGFDGAIAETFLKRANLSSKHPIVSTGNNVIYKKMRIIYKLLANHSFNNMIKANITLFEIFYQLFDLIKENKKTIKATKNIYVLRAEEYIKEHYNTDISIDEIATYLFVHRSYLSNLFSTENGITIKQYLTKYRLKQSLILLENNDINISQIAEQVGFPDFVCFYRQFKKAFNLSPSEYRKKIVADPRYKENISIKLELNEES